MIILALTGSTEAVEESNIGGFVIQFIVNQ